MNSWNPEPLVDEVPAIHPVFQNKRMVTKIHGKYIRINEFNCLNLGTHNYLGLLNSSDIRESAIGVMQQYGVGSCGPRAFYGTFGNKNIHLGIHKAMQLN